jgi:hypothetical protein
MYNGGGILPSHRREHFDPSGKNKLRKPRLRLLISIVLFSAILFLTFSKGELPVERVEKVPETMGNVEAEQVLNPVSPEPKDKANEILKDKPKDLKHQSEQERYPNNPILWNTRADAVKSAFLHSYNGYKKYAWGMDELHPISKRGSDWFGLGLTIMDTLDGAWIMGLKDVFKECRDWTANEMKFARDTEANVFEVTIRVLGGLLSAYHFSQDIIFLEKAEELGNILLLAFNTASQIPLASINFATRQGVPASHNGGASSTAEVATLQLEFKYLSYLTENPKFWKAAEGVMLAMEKLPKLDGLVPIFISPISGQFVGDEIRLGSRGDSYYGMGLLRVANGRRIFD